MDNLRQRVTLSDVLSDGGIEMSSGQTYTLVKKLYLPINIGKYYYTGHQPYVDINVDLVDKNGHIYRENDYLNVYGNGTRFYLDKNSLYYSINIVSDVSVDEFGGNTSGYCIRWYVLTISNEYKLVYCCYPLSLSESGLYPYCYKPEYICIDFSIFDDINYANLTYFNASYLLDDQNNTYKCYYVPA